MRLLPCGHTDDHVDLGGLSSCGLQSDHLVGAQHARIGDDLNFGVGELFPVAVAVARGVEARDRRELRRPRQQPHGVLETR